VKRLAIDPDTQASGFALYEGLHLKVCGLLHRGVNYDWEFVTTGVSLVVVELPQIYQRRKSRGDPNDLVRLAAAAGELVGALGLPHRYYLPREWKGGVSKKNSHARMRDFFASQDDASSLALLQDASRKYADEPLLDVLDACALGLWAARKDLKP
jgi:hypothetical protein